MRPLESATIQAILTRVTYKPGWKIRSYPGDFHGPHIVITTVVPDATRPGESTVLDVHSDLPPLFSEDQFIRWLAWRLAQIEIHEMREFLQVDGVAPFDPHAENAARDNFNYEPMPGTDRLGVPVEVPCAMAPPL
jgi:hypothetical protein